MLALLVLLFAQPSAARATDTLRFSLASPAATTERSEGLRRGVVFGLEEAKHTGAMFGWAVVLHAGEQEVLPHVVIEGRGCDALAARSEWIVFNLSCRADSTRSATRYPNVFHVELQDSVYRAGGNQVVWRDDLERYGAAQLNERYRRRFNQGMTGEAWAGWFVVKTALEAAMKARSTKAPPLRQALVESVGFDGHKGQALRFDPLTQQLQHPLYEAVSTGTIK